MKFKKRRNEMMVIKGAYLECKTPKGRKSRRG